MAEKSKSMEPLGDGMLEIVMGGTRQKYVSSFYCEKCGKTIQLSGVYRLEVARQDHERKVHSGPVKTRL